VKGRRFILWFSAFVVFLGVTNILEGLSRHKIILFVLGVWFLVFGVYNCIVRMRHD
jgi:hypothetical protein